ARDAAPPPVAAPAASAAPPPQPDAIGSTAPEQPAPVAAVRAPAAIARAASLRTARGTPSRREAPAPRGAASQPEARAVPGDFEVKCANAGAEDLAALADAAHFARDEDREAYAWRLLRRRFPGTPRAGLAAFALGRLEFDAHGSYAKAAEWFGTYLKEQP